MNSGRNICIWGVLRKARNVSEKLEFQGGKKYGHVISEIVC